MPGTAQNNKVQHSTAVYYFIEKKQYSFWQFSSWAIQHSKVQYTYSTDIVNNRYSTVHIYSTVHYIYSIVQCRYRKLKIQYITDTVKYSYRTVQILFKYICIYSIVHVLSVHCTLPVLYCTVHVHVLYWTCTYIVLYNVQCTCIVLCMYCFVYELNCTCIVLVLYFTELYFNEPYFTVHLLNGTSILLYMY